VQDQTHTGQEGYATYMKREPLEVFMSLPQRCRASSWLPLVGSKLALCEITLRESGVKHQRRTQKMLVESSLSSSGRREEERPQESRAHTDRIELAGYVSHQPAGQPAARKTPQLLPTPVLVTFVCVCVCMGCCGE
jgi:hypothetical protein